jgi:hypothetical protein
MDAPATVYRIQPPFAILLEKIMIINFCTLIDIRKECIITVLECKTT